MSAEIQELWEIRKMLINKSCLTCINGSCTVPTREKVGFENGKPVGSECVGWLNERIEEKAKRLKKYDVNELRRD